MLIDYNNPDPLYKQIVKDLTEQVQEKNLHPHQQIPSQRELSEYYQVSMITVKKAISELINQGILYSRVGKGTYVAKPPQGLEVQNQQTIGLVLTSLKSPYFSMIAHEVERKASEEGYTILLANSSGKPEKEKQQLRRFLEMGVNGLIVVSMTRDYSDDNIFHDLHDEKVPYVVVSYVNDPAIYHVGTAHEEGAFLATEHLIKQGFESIGYISGEYGNILGDVREAGFRRAMMQYKMDIREEFIFHLPLEGEWNDFQSGYIIARDFLNMKQRPRAIFAYNDLAALGFQEAIAEHGLTVPGDVALVGFDDIDRAQYASVPLTTIRQPVPEICNVAVDKLLSQIHHEPVETQSILQPELIVRKSSGTLSRNNGNYTTVPEHLKIYK
ncbi:MAG: substrate-binding domain-containing protein [Candidatus Marinimicrobia bacterium]|nr:substrate-binding domain-containing protein [Candidatus Neomarinimicrobiota bacterium]